MELLKLRTRNVRFLKTGFVVAVLAACTAFQSVSAQGVKITRVEDTQNVEEDTTVYVKVDVLPEYPGGDEARMKFLQENLVYPKFPRRPERDGHIVIGFVVEKDGSLTNFSIIKSESPALDEESLRIVKLMPKWIPGKLDGKVVRVQFQTPITFTFMEDGKTTETKKGKKREK